MIGPAPSCLECSHYHRGTRRCDAFSLQIPGTIWLEGNPHTGPVTGDNGIQFSEGKPQGNDKRQ
jgi:hypothetical protein